MNNNCRCIMKFSAQVFFKNIVCCKCTSTRTYYTYHKVMFIVQHIMYLPMYICMYIVTFDKSWNGEKIPTPPGFEGRSPAAKTSTPIVDNGDWPRYSIDCYTYTRSNQIWQEAKINGSEYFKLNCQPWRGVEMEKRKQEWSFSCSAPTASTSSIQETLDWRVHLSERWGVYLINFDFLSG